MEQLPCPSREDVTQHVQPPSSTFESQNISSQDMNLDSSFPRDCNSPMTKGGESTHNHIFGNPYVSPQRAGKIYYMSSDIFGVGSIVDREGQHMGNRAVRKEGKACIAASRERMFETSDSSSRVGKVQSFQNLGDSPDLNTSDYAEKKPNARENGCNPVTGHGYAEGDPGKTQKRQYPRGRSQSLW